MCRTDCQNLNCFLDSVLGSAAFIGTNHLDSLATLWSETDFRYDPRFDVFLTKRMPQNLETLGMKTQLLKSGSQEEAAEDLARLQNGELIIVGMDTFHIPWCPVYQFLHGPHYFFAQYQGKGAFACFDPTYEKEHMPATCEIFAPHAFELFRIVRGEGSPIQIDLGQQAQEITLGHPPMCASLLAQIGECNGSNRRAAHLLARYVHALITNRQLFQQHLLHSPSWRGAHGLLFDSGFFSRWETVKNGLYKASLMQNNEAVLDEVAVLMKGLLKDEVAKAECLLQPHPLSVPECP